MTRESGCPFLRGRPHGVDHAKAGRGQHIPPHTHSVRSTTAPRYRAPPSPHDFRQISINYQPSDLHHASIYSTIANANILLLSLSPLSPSPSVYQRALDILFAGVRKFTPPPRSPRCLGLGFRSGSRPFSSSPSRHRFLYDGFERAVLIESFVFYVGHGVELRIGQCLRRDRDPWGR